MLGSDLTAALLACVAAADLDPETPLTATIRIGARSASYNAPVPSCPQRKIGRSTLLYAASLAKQITGACVALALEEGLIDADDTLARWFPELPDWAAGVNLTHLLKHTGALPKEEGLLERMRDTGETARTSNGMLAALQTFNELEDVPGTRYCYANIGYVCLARIVELAASEELNVFATRRIFEPVGMTSTRFWPGPDAIPIGAIPVEDEPIAGQPFSLGDGGLWTTVDDYQRWNDAMNRDLLGIASIVQQTGALNDGTPDTYAWGIRRIEQDGVVGWSHGGSWPGIASKAVRFPELQASFVAFALESETDPILRLTAQVQTLLVDPAWR